MTKKQVMKCFKEEEVINNILHDFTLLKDQVSVDCEMTTESGHMEG